MYSAASIYDMARFYGRDHQNTHMSGIWSVLLTQNATESKIFGEKYFSKFNDLARQDWHLGICAEMRHQDGVRVWSESEKMQKVSDGVRKDLERFGTVVPECCIVFFDPVLSGLHKRGFVENGLPENNYEARAVIVDLDWSRIGDTDLFMRGFMITHKAIMNALHDNHIRQGDVIEDEKYENILRSLGDEIQKIGMRHTLTPWISRAKDSFFAAAVGALLS